MFRTAVIGIFLFGLIATAQQQPGSPARAGFARDGVEQPPSPATQPSPAALAPDQQPAPQQPQLSDEEVMARAVKTAQATMRWDAASTPGMKAEVVLLEKREATNLVLVQYHLKVSGAPHNQPYTLMAWPVTMAEPAAMMDGLAVAQDGTVGCPATSTGSCGQRFKGAELRLSYEATKGEIFRHALVSLDQKSRIFFSIVPDPILASDKACSLEVVRLSPHFELVLVRGKGFPPNETLRFHEQSFQEAHDLPVTANDQGEFQAQLTPAIKGRVAGTSDVTVTAKTCAPTISFNWGEEP